MTDIIAGFLTDILSSAFGVFDAQMTSMLQSILFIENMFGDIFSADMVAQVYKFVYEFSIALLTLKFLFKGFQIYILWRDGDADCSPQDMLIGAGEAVVVVVCFPYLYQIMADITLWFASGLMSSFTLSDDAGWTTLQAALFSMGIIQILICIVFVIMALVLYVKLIQRGVELLIMRIALPIGCLGLLDSDFGIFKAFTQTFYKTMFTSVIQIVLFSLSFRIVAQFTIVNLILAIAVLSTAFATPTLMQSLLVPTRPGGGGMSKMYQGAQLARMLRGMVGK